MTPSICQSLTGLKFFRPPPGEQRYHDRWSLVYFFRPHSDSELRPLTESFSVAAAALKHRIDIEPGTTAGEWFSRRTKNFRAKNWKVTSADLLVPTFSESSVLQGKASWEAARGTEYVRTDG
jgi:hypothetical protein